MKRKAEIAVTTILFIIIFFGTIDIILTPKDFILDNNTTRPEPR